MFHSFDIFRPYPQLTAGYTDRDGGVSQGSYASFNCHPDGGDDPRAVAANRTRLEQALGMRLITARQTHGTEILHVNRAFLEAFPSDRSRLQEGKDALITAEPGFIIGVHTADCIPLLLYDRRQQVCAAIHAGWRGTVAGITTKTLTELSHTYGSRPDDLLAAIGPGISQMHYEVGDEVYQAFRDAAFPMEQIAFRSQPFRKWHIDLKEANRHLLTEYGLTASQITDAGICTLQDTNYFSARRMGIRSGRILTYIGICK